MPQAQPAERKYVAFISYRHKPADIAWAKWLHDEIERFVVPDSLVQQGHPKRLRPVFRDQEDLPVDANLSKSLETALEGSGCLIVVCSPRTPESVWVRQEIERFRALGRGDRILAVLIEGEPDQSFPEPLRFVDREVVTQAGERVVIRDRVEPLAADVRPGGGQEASTKVRNRKALVRVVAAILGVGFDELWQREARRRRRVMQTWIASVAAVMLAMAGLTGVAVWQRGVAKEQEQLAKANEREAVAAGERALERLIFTEAGSRADANPAIMRLILRELPAALRTELPASTRDKWLKNSDDQLRLRLRGHEGLVTAVAWSPNGTSLATGGRDGRVLLWEIATLASPSVVTQHRGEISALEWSSQGNVLATSCINGLVKIIRTDSMEIKQVDIGEPVTSLNMSKDGTFLCITSTLNSRGESRISISEVSEFGNGRSGYGAIAGGARWCPVSQRVLVLPNNGGNAFIVDMRQPDSSMVPLEAPDPLAWFAGAEWSPNAQFIASASYDNVTRVWRAHGEQAVQELPEVLDNDNYTKVPVRDVSWRYDSEYLALYARYSGKAVIVWDMESGQPYSISFEDQLRDVAWQPLGDKLLILTDDGVMSLWDSVTRALQWTKNVGDVGSFSWSPDGTQFVTTLSDGTVCIWSTGGYPEPKVVGLQVDSEVGTSGLEYSPDGRYLAEAFGDGRFRVLSTDDWSIVYAYDYGMWIADMSWSPGGNLIAIAGGKNTIEIIDPITKRDPTVFGSRRDLAGSIDAIAWSPCGDYIASAANDRNVMIWQVGARDVVIKNVVMEDQVHDLSWGEGGKKLIVAAGNRVCEIDLQGAGGGSRILDVHNDVVTSVSWSESSGYVVSSAKDGVVSVVEPSDQSFNQRFVFDWRALPYSHMREIDSVAWSPDGKRVIAGSKDRIARVWSLVDSRPCIELRGHDKWVDAVAWSPDGNEVATATGHRGVRIWIVDWHNIRRMLWHSTGAYLFAQERIDILGETPAEASANEAIDRAWVAELVAAKREGRPLPEPPVTPRRR